jgi:diguanylate cyclase (GGDEF)-like protein/PAS domain S-box-containing protein
MISPPSDAAGDRDLAAAEIARLKDIVRALMDRAERSTIAQGSDFSVFQRTVLLQEQVRRRTAELERALQDNEQITRNLRETEARFAGLASQSLVGITLIEDGAITYSNDKFGEIFGYDADEIATLAPSDFAVDADRRLVRDYLTRRLSGELDRVSYTFRGRRKDGAIIDIECHGSVMWLSEKPVLISMLMDITERVRAERAVLVLQEQLREQSTHDALTGLFNRRYLADNIEREIALAEREHQPISVIMADLDHFKTVNDQHGHQAGDQVLRHFADLVRANSRSSDICCRYGGEEFLLVLPRMPHTAARARAEQLRAAIADTTIPYTGHRLQLTASFGIATYPNDAATADDLVASADAALYRAKEHGRNRVETSQPPAQTPSRILSPAASVT